MLSVLRGFTPLSLSILRRHVDSYIFVNCMGDYANCCYSNISIFSARQKTMLAKQNRRCPSKYSHSVSIHVIENSQLSAWLNKCLFPLPTLPLFFLFFLTWKWAEYHVCGWSNFLEECLLQLDLCSRNCWYKLNQSTFPPLSSSFLMNASITAPFACPFTCQAAQTKGRWNVKMGSKSEKLI